MTQVHQANTHVRCWPLQLNLPSLWHVRKVNQTNCCPFKNVSVTSDLGVGSGLGVTTTLTLLQEPEFHGEDKASTCYNKWQTSAMLVSDTNAHVFTSDRRTDRRLRRSEETQRGGSGVGGPPTTLKPFTERRQMVVCAHMLTHILRRSHAEIHQTGVIHDLWSHRGATNTTDTLHTCVTPDAGNQEYLVMDTIFTVKHTVHKVNSYSPSEGTLYLYHCT